MEFNKVVEKISSNPSYITNGAGYLSKLLKCSKEDVYKAKKIVRGMSNNTNIPQKKILIIDIETAPMRSYTWGRWKQNVGLNQTISEFFLISWSAKWLYDTETMSDVLTPEEAIAEDDCRIVTKLWDLLDEAVIVIAHNGKSFDIPKINSRLILNGLPPVSSYTQIDTLEVVKKNFGFSSNKLDALCRYFGFDVKLDTNFELWKGCMNGDKESLYYMEKYNKNDVDILEEVYLRLRPWIKMGFNMSLLNDSENIQCCSCGSNDIHEIDNKLYYTSVGAYKMYRCSCGAISRGRKSILTKSKSKTTLTSVGK